MQSTYTMMQPLRKEINCLEVPNLAHVPEKYHGLFAKIRKQPFIDTFQMAKGSNKMLLILNLREGETFNMVVRARIMSLFAGHKFTFLPSKPNHPVINIELPI